MRRSRAFYATGHAERVAERARSFVRNQIKTRDSKTIPKELADELVKYLSSIERDWRVPRRIRDKLKQSVWDEFEIEREPFRLISTVQDADRRKRLGY